MARRYKKSRKVSQRQYRARRKAYSAYVARYGGSDVDIKSFSEWNAKYREKKFLQKEFKIYKERFQKRLESSRVPFYDEEEIQSFQVFKDVYIRKRNDLILDVAEGDRERVGSVVNEIIDDQIYELSSPKAMAVADYLLREEREILAEKGILRTTTDEEGRIQDVIKRRKLLQLVRQGDFVKEEIGLWDEISVYYKTLVEGGYSAKKAREKIGQTYFHSGEKGQQS